MAKSNGNNFQEIATTLQDQVLSLGDKTMAILKIGSLTDFLPSALTELQSNWTFTLVSHTQMARVQLCVCLCSWKEEHLICSSLSECIFLNERLMDIFQQCKEFTSSSCSVPHGHLLLLKEAGVWISHLNTVKLADRWKLTNAMKSTKAIQLSSIKCV